MPAIIKELAQYKIQQDITKKKLGQAYYSKLNLVFPRQDGYFTDTGTFLDNIILDKQHIPQHMSLTNYNQLS